MTPSNQIVQTVVDLMTDDQVRAYFANSEIPSEILDLETSEHRKYEMKDIRHQLIQDLLLEDKILDTSGVAVTFTKDEHTALTNFLQLVTVMDIRLYLNGDTTDYGVLKEVFDKVIKADFQKLAVKRNETNVH